jgi:preprotein translocase subunit SecD
MKHYRNFAIIIVIIITAIYLNIPNHPGIHIGSLDIEVKTRLGLDLVGGVQALLEADMPPDTPVDPESMRTARTIVENRVNPGGTAETIVQQAGERRILVELPGETDPEQALASIQQTGLLEFVDMSMLSPQEALLLTGTRVETDFAHSGTTQPDVSTPSIPTEEISPTLPIQTAQEYHTIMTGASLQNVGVITTQTGGYEVAFELDNEGANIFQEYTRQHVGDVLAILLDKEVISAPTINSEIPDGKGVITGRFTLEEANSLSTILKYGSLPIPLKVVSTQTVGPTLGEDSLNQSLIAGLVGLGIVMLYMGLYYRLPGIIADLALISYATITLALFRFNPVTPVTLTLPGIAGFVLSIGVAVDANVLIFERLKEELRSGRKLSQAIDLGWSRAWPSIRDSNISTLITCSILYWFGSQFGASIVKGFSLTLAIGVGISMFTAIIVTRTFLHLVLDNLEFKVHKGWFGV